VLLITPGWEDDVCGSTIECLQLIGLANAKESDILSWEFLIHSGNQSKGGDSEMFKTSLRM